MNSLAIYFIIIEKTNYVRPNMAYHLSLDSFAELGNSIGGCLHCERISVERQQCHIMLSIMNFDLALSNCVFSTSKIIIIINVFSGNAADFSIVSNSNFSNIFCRAMEKTYTCLACHGAYCVPSNDINALA